MTNYKRFIYDNAPLQEAVFEIRFSQDGFDSASTGQFYEKIKKDYPHKENLQIFQFIVGNNPNDKEAPHIPPPQSPSLKAWSSDKEKVLQVGPGILTANHLKYKDFEDFQPMVSAGLKNYLEICTPKSVQRVGTRFINRFLIPNSSIILSDYFNFSLVPPGPLKNSNAFQVVFLNSFINAKTGQQYEVKVRFGSESLRPGESGIAFSLDLDSYSTFNFSANYADILEVGEIAHSYVGEIFESFLTQGMRNILKPRSE
jgi:uncharacterized protein (TIGR04255 family)